MAADQYLKVAASNMRRAIVEMQSEVQRLRQDAERVQRDVDKEIDSLDTDRVQSEAYAVRPQTDSFTKARLIKQAHDAKKAIDNKQQQVKEVEDNIQQTIRSMEDQIRDLQSTASQFEGRWGV